MREDVSQKNVVVEESEVPVSDVIQAMALGLPPEVWRDAKALAPLIDGCDLARSLSVVQTIRGLSYLPDTTPADLELMGLSPSECARLLAIPVLAQRLLMAPSKPYDLSTRADLADEIVRRGTAWDQVIVGVIAWDGAGKRVADRLLAAGTSEIAYFEPRQALRIAIAAPGTTSWVVWVWQPAVPRIRVTPSDRANADQLRMLSSGVGLEFTDLLLISQEDRVSMAVYGQWVE